ncbi:GumC family protein [Occallatibacter savannae]|uniref:GumC family protein n=1 Tax=Occallatibacter savannae TaxID=1002691 RepID=UPI000D699FF0|nr:Wzz/FepE/Etk N-terminal domain-containing protein [Occallatibacter savannae]
MHTGSAATREHQNEATAAGASPNWVVNANLLWQYRALFLKAAAIGALISVAAAFLIPKRYESTARIMPPESTGSSAALLAALAGRGASEYGSIGSIAANLLAVRTTGPLFVDLLRSATVSDHLIERFQLQQIYSKRYRVDAAKKLARRTSVVEDKRSGVISITVEDGDPQRARDLAQAYLDELNLLVNRTNTSSARQERTFIERRLKGAEAELERAQNALSEFSSTHSTIDMKEQTRATVDAAAKLQAQLILEQTELDSMLQIYGDQNVRVRAARARISGLRSQLQAIGGTSEPLQADGTISADNNGLLRAGADYPPLRQLPRLAVPYADIYRHVRVQEAVYEMLTQQYELARIQEAKDVPVVRVIDAPGIPEKKSFPPRTVLCVVLTTLTMMITAGLIIGRFRWREMSPVDERRILGAEIMEELHRGFQRLFLQRLRHG